MRDAEFVQEIFDDADMALEERVDARGCLSITCISDVDKIHVSAHRPFRDLVRDYILMDPSDDDALRLLLHELQQATNDVLAILEAK